jgi:hypothetical protein
LIYFSRQNSHSSKSLHNLLKISILWSVFWIYVQWPHILKVPSEIMEYIFTIYDKFQKLTLFLMCFIHYISAIWIFFVYQVQKGHYMYTAYKYHLLLGIYC